MKTNEIKKALYKEKPTAKKTSFIADYYNYVTQLENGTIVEFNIPKKEGEHFEDNIPAQLLIRWLSLN